MFWLRRHSFLRASSALIIFLLAVPISCCVWGEQSEREAVMAAAAAAVLHALVALSLAGAVAAAGRGGEQPLSRIGIHRTTFAIQPGASVDASPLLLGLEVLQLSQQPTVSTSSSIQHSLLFFALVRTYIVRCSQPLPLTRAREF